MENKETTYTNLDVELVALWDRTAIAAKISGNMEDLVLLHKQIGQQILNIALRFVKIRDTSGSVAEQNEDWFESDFYAKVKQINAKFE